MAISNVNENANGIFDSEILKIRFQLELYRAVYVDLVHVQIDRY